MLTKRLPSVFKKRLTKYLSTVSSPKIENDLPEESVNSEKHDILQDPDYFKVRNLFTVTDLFKAKVHLGHKSLLTHCNMKPFIFGERLGHTIFDLDKTAYHLREALNFTAHIAYRDGIILFVSKNPGVTLLVERTAKNCQEFALTREWPFGMMTDSSNKFNTYIRLPDLLICLNTIEENGFLHMAVLEAAKMCIPTVGIVDSNCDPNLVTYPVPGNDDSYSSVQLYCELFQSAILRGKNQRKKDLETSKVEQKDSEVEDTQSTSNKTSNQENSDNVRTQ